MLELTSKNNRRGLPKDYACHLRAPSHCLSTLTHLNTIFRLVYVQRHYESIRSIYKQFETTIGSRWPSGLRRLIRNQISSEAAVQTRFSMLFVPETDGL